MHLEWYCWIALVVLLIRTPFLFLYSRSERADLVRMLLADGVAISDAARWLRNEFGMNLQDSCGEVLEVYRSEVMYAPRSKP